MALIACTECNNQVSDKAKSCPKCGAPVMAFHEQNSIGTPLTTTQLTSKRLKLHTLMATIVVIVGVIWWIGSPRGYGGGYSAGPVLTTFIGFIWFIIARIRTWWHHG